MSNFEEIEISTKTIICKTNWKIDINSLFQSLPITEYKIIQKKRGRRPKNDKVMVEQKLENGEIITLKLGDKMRGVNIKQNKKKSAGFFRNSLTIVMQSCDKLINLKVSKNGNFHFTGAKDDDSVQKCIEYIKKYVDDKVLQTISKPCITFLSVMTNINFSLGFNVNRENLDRFINDNTENYSLLETSFGYTGVNIKIPIEEVEFPVRVMTLENNNWVRDTILYSEYVSKLEEKEQIKEKNKIKYGTFLVFQSGNVILSAPHKDCMKNIFNKFMQIISDCKHLIEEKID